VVVLTVATHVGQAASTGLEHAKKIDEKYQVTTKVQAGVVSATKQAQKIDQSYDITGKITQVLEKVGNLDKALNISGTVKKIDETLAISQKIDTVDKSLGVSDTVKSLDQKYGVTETLSNVKNNIEAEVNGVKFDARLDWEFEADGDNNNCIVKSSTGETSYAGQTITSINKVSVVGKPHAEIIKLLQQTELPLLIVFKK
jgi:hypothetical protein